MLTNRARWTAVVAMAVVMVGSGSAGPVAGPAARAAEAPSTAQSQSEQDRAAPLFDNLGDHHHPTTTDSDLAQRHFDQGLTLVYGFSHEEAVRQFRAATALDPDCAMAYWGIALAYGPNINAWPPLKDEDARAAYQAIQKAQKLVAKQGTAKEKAYIAAMVKRHAPEPLEDRGELDQAYMEAMRDLARRYPDDMDAATLYVDAIMNTTPWDYWTQEGEPKPIAAEAMREAERVIRRDPDHPGANHLYIHLVEAGPRPEMAERSADRLRDLVPGAGHLVHMPSHIYARVGRYADAMAANERAIKADESYISQCRAQGFYPLSYYPHNIHFLWYSAMLAGDSGEAIDAAEKIRGHLEKDKHLTESQRLSPVLTFSLVRFGQWDRLLEQERPAEDQPYATAMHHYGRGIALARTGQLDEAAESEKALAEIAQDEAVLEKLETPVFYGGTQVRIAHQLLAGELAGARGDKDAMVDHMKQAVELQDQLPYMEPPYWYYPTRHSLGAALLEAGKPAEAEAVYRENLEKYPRNGWALFGLMQSLRAQGKGEAASDVQRQFSEVWQIADVKLTGSRF